MVVLFLFGVIMKKKTLVVGASTNPERYAYKAIVKLREQGIDVVAFGNRVGEVAGVQIEKQWNASWQVDTVTIYVGPANQEELIPQVIALNPKRVVFNPGTENPHFFSALNDAGIHFEAACTLVLLATNTY